MITPNQLQSNSLIVRRRFIGSTTTALVHSALFRSAFGQSRTVDDKAIGKPLTVFQHACMTLPYSQFPLKRALSGIQSAGFRHIAWGVTHREANGEQVPVMAEDATEDTARQLGSKCRDLGLEPVMMFSTIYPEHPKALPVLTQRIKQAAAAGIGQVLTFGHTEGGNRKVWIERFRQLGPIARDHGVTIVVKQHGGTTGTGEACAEIVREVNDPNIWMNYDAGNVMDYLNLDPIPDIKKSAAEVRSFCVKDHRNWPKDQDCGPALARSIITNSLNQ